MSLIRRIVIPERELASRGLCGLEMGRLGRLVALAGKNGAGKSRIMSAVEEYVNRRASELQNLDRRGEEIRNLENAINGNASNNPNQPNWKKLLLQARASVRFATEYITPKEHGQTFQAFRFVPKKLELADHRAHVRTEAKNRVSRARAKGAVDYDATCLFYVQHVVDRWWNTGHQRFMGKPEEVTEAATEYESLQALITRLLGVRLKINSDGDATLFDKPVADAGLSDGQKVILQLCVALHAQKGDLDNTVFLLDEPENHLHPSAAIDLLSTLCQVAPNSQVWIATHSIPLLAYVTAEEPMSMWYVADGKARNAGRHPELVLNALLGGDEGIAQLRAFTSLPATLAMATYAAECLLPPGVVAEGVGDDQVNQVAVILARLRESSPLSVLDFGAGKGRLLQGIQAELELKGKVVKEQLDYFAYDEFPHSRRVCEEVIEEVYGSASKRYFPSREEFFSAKEDGSIRVIVMCNVLHEVSPTNWLNLFSEGALISRCLATDGFLLLVEDQRISIGEKAHDYGFIVLDTSHLRTLFSVKDEDVAEGSFVLHDRRNGRLKAHLIAKRLLLRATAETRIAAVRQLRDTARENIMRVRGEAPSYGNGQLHAFWTQQFANSSLYLNDAAGRLD